MPTATNGTTKKKVKRRDKEAEEPTAAPRDAEAAAAPSSSLLANAHTQKDLKTDRQLYEIIRGSRVCEDSRRNAERPHKFWDTQPVPKFKDELKDAACGPLEEDKTPGEVRQEPYALPDQFEWATCDVTDEKEMTEIYTLLSENYVEDDDNMFRFDYSVAFLHWALTPPGFVSDWHVGVRVKDKKKKLVGFITGIPAQIRIYDSVIDMAEINFLCVHKKLRSKRLAPVLIKEITRRVNLTNRWQAVYTAGVTLPKPVASCRYWHRSLNPKKLFEVGFSHLGRHMTISRAIKLYRLPDDPVLEGIRGMEACDIPEVTRLLADYLSSYQLHPTLDEEEVRHWLMPRAGVVYSYVRVINKEVTDFLSFYSLPSSVIGNEKHKTLWAAYSYYNVAKTVPLKDLMNDALTLAKIEGFDVFNALDVMENDKILKDLKFGIGDGFLQYYLYNYRCPETKSRPMGPNHRSVAPVRPLTPLPSPRWENMGNEQCAPSSVEAAEWSEWSECAACEGQHNRTKLAGTCGLCPRDHPFPFEFGKKWCKHELNPSTGERLQFDASVQDSCQDRESVACDESRKESAHCTESTRTDEEPCRNETLCAAESAGGVIDEDLTEEETSSPTTPFPAVTTPTPTPTPTLNATIQPHTQNVTTVSPQPSRNDTAGESQPGADGGQGGGGGGGGDVLISRGLMTTEPLSLLLWFVLLLCLFTWLKGR
ncbi:unnamed protein product [Vitrella brassicaformis CCMP3155]|uniref:Glycylpeptide N-tetradecanoyltransferase n=1 Tax=Vitrella brassicaformis (strain CCMP3155) TaxID=1169540 RepID=A0A0G4H0M8_VITBC|nr:unnamed protein product [Vitrella brassicaformis CCMP3155]|eukprot:CEM36970.1 unnamed protein product [Vitrella brassicaformis CCMP3155]